MDIIDVYIIATSVPTRVIMTIVLTTVGVNIAISFIRSQIS